MVGVIVLLLLILAKQKGESTRPSAYNILLVYSATQERNCNSEAMEYRARDTLSHARAVPNNWWWHTQTSYTERERDEIAECAITLSKISLYLQFQLFM